LAQRLATADLQGAYMRVARAAAASYIGVAGVVIRETVNTFELVTPPPRSRCKTVRKQGCVFELAVGDCICSLQGSLMVGRQ
ncbi:unnamed protein product, partial [Phaeothamnion confervicola]